MFECSNENQDVKVQIHDPKRSKIAVGGQYMILSVLGTTGDLSPLAKGQSVPDYVFTIEDYDKVLFHAQ